VATEIVCKDKFKEALDFARKLGGEPKRSFLHCLWTLNRIKRNNKWDLVIWEDWVKHSFSFVFRKDKDFIMNGGMILHGFENTLTVSLENHAAPYWSIHT